MACQDLRDFLDRLEKAGDLQRIGVEVDPELEITEITDRVSKLPGGGTALLFERVKGSRFPTATNLFGSTRRTCVALELEELSQLSRRMTELVQHEATGDRHDDGAALAGNPDFARFKPVAVGSGACQEIQEQFPDLTRYPFLRNWPGDGLPGDDGRFITLPLVFTRDPVSGAANCGIYLVQVISPDSAGIFWRSESGGGRHLSAYRARNERMPVAIVLGGDPALLYSALLPLPADVDEMQFSGFLRNEPVDLVPCLTSGIMVPANAEMVIEGYLYPGETVSGGGYGNHTGYYSPERAVPVMHVTCITRRREPILPATVIGRPPMEDCQMAKVAERLMLPLTRLRLPEVVEINLPLEGIFHVAAIVSIAKRFPGHARKVMETLWNGGWLKGSRLLVVVDEDVDVHDLSWTFWKVLNSVDWDRDLVFAGYSGEENSSGRNLPFGGRLGIDATRKLPGEGVAAWPREVAMESDIKDLVTRRWREYGFHE
jgi:4-hydroxy-3-polyprenylbenzoate decarboxylase